MQAFRRSAPEVPHHRRRFQVGLRIALLRVHEVRKLDRILDEEHRCVVADEVPVAFLGVEADGEAARIALGIGAAAFAAYGREAHEGLGGLADGREQLGLGVLRDVVRDGEGAVSARPLGVHHALGNALAVEVLQLLDEVEILQQDRPARAGGDRVLVVGDGDAGSGGKRGQDDVPFRKVLRRATGAPALPQHSHEQSIRLAPSREPAMTRRCRSRDHRNFRWSASPYLSRIR